MPITTAWVDAFREVFGDPAAIHAKENGIEVKWRK